MGDLGVRTSEHPERTHDDELAEQALAESTTRRQGDLSPVLKRRRLTTWFAILTADLADIRERDSTIPSARATADGQARSPLTPSQLEVPPSRLGTDTTVIHNWLVDVASSRDETNERGDRVLPGLVDASLPRP